MRVFITGGAGFIGSHVLRSFLKSGYNICMGQKQEKKIIIVEKEKNI